MASGRSGTGAHRYRKARAQVLAESDWCWLCEHGGAQTVDHIITPRDWPRGPDGRHLPGLDDPANLRPAHGTMGNRKTGGLNPCPVCGQLCNQVRGDRPLPQPNRKPW